MIFVTVGTHEQQFNRLLKKLDELKEKNIIKDDIVIQTGYSDYKLQYCKGQKFFSYKKMEKMFEEADVIITHGGPATFMGVLSKGKIPIVVPRQKNYDEHVNNHQLEFCSRVKEKYPIVVVENIEKLEEAIFNNKKEKVEIKSNNQKFCRRLEEMIQKG